MLQIGGTQSWKRDVDLLQFTLKKKEKEEEVRFQQDLETDEVCSIIVQKEVQGINDNRIDLRKTSPLTEKKKKKKSNNRKTLCR